MIRPVPIIYSVISAMIVPVILSERLKVIPTIVVGKDISRKNIRCVLAQYTAPTYTLLMMSAAQTEL